MTLLTGSDIVVAAKNIRLELKAAYPATKFSVTTKRFSMGNSIDVRWTDGPTVEQVNKIARKYQYGEFDGMTDCYNYSRSDFNEQHGGAKYVQVTREYSDALVMLAIDEVQAKYGQSPVVTLAAYRSGSLYMTSPDGWKDYQHSYQSLIGAYCCGAAA